MKVRRKHPSLAARQPELQLCALEPRVLFSAAPADAGGDAAAGDGADSAEALSSDSPGVSAFGDLALLLPELSPADSSANADEAGNPPSLTSAEAPLEIVFLDTRVEDYATLLDELVATTDSARRLEFVLLDESGDGVTQVGDALHGREDVAALHFITHGDDGLLQLGGQWLSLEELDRQAGAVRQWGDSLSSEADLLFYGCNLAQSAEGTAFLEALSLLTGADVAASADLTGSAALGGDWELEHHVGQLETQALLAGGWQGLLDITTGLVAHLPFDDGAGTAAVDVSGNGNTGMLMGDEDWITSPLGGAFRLDGEDFFEIGNSPTLENVQEGSFTLAAWFEAKSTPGGSGSENDAMYGVLAKEGSHTGIMYTGTKQFYFEHHLGTGLVQVTSSSTFDTGKTHHVAVTVDRPAGLVTMYVNGAVEGVSAFAPGAASLEYGTETWKIGTARDTFAPNTSAFPADGEVDDVRIYDRALDGEDVVELASMHYCDVLDDFDGGGGYADNDGSQDFAAPWVETDVSGGGSGGGNIYRWSGMLVVNANNVGDEIYRAADLSGATYATLTYDVTNSLGMGAGEIVAEISGDGGASWSTLETYDVLSLGSSSESFDISAFASADTQVRFRVQNTLLWDWVGIDNLRIQYDCHPANAAPVLDDKNAVLNSTSEDAGLPSGPVGTLVLDFANPKGDGGLDNIDDPDKGALPGIALTGANTANGTWHYTTDGGLSWSLAGAVSDTDALLLAADAVTRVYFQPAGSYSGTMADALTFHAWDQTSGAVGDRVNISGGESFADRFNGAPSYSNSDGDTSWTGPWVENDVDGAGELGGAVQINSDMLLLNPHSGAGGNWIYREADLGQADSATLSFDYNNVLAGGQEIHVQVSSDGGVSYSTLDTFNSVLNAGAGGFSMDISAWLAEDTRIRFLYAGVDSGSELEIDNLEVAAVTSSHTGGESAFSVASDTAELTVTSGNDAPTTSGIADVAAAEDDAATVFSLHPSFADEEDADTDLTYAVTGNTIPGVVSTSINATGDLTLSYLPDQSGSGTITVRATDTGGLWVETAFNVDVAAANDAPTSSGIADVSVSEDDAATTFNLYPSFADTEDADTDLAYAVTGNTIPGVVSTGIDAAGDLTLTYLPDQFGSGTITVRATDSGGLWVETAFNVDVSPINDAPTSSGIADVSVVEDDSPSVLSLFPSFADLEDADTDLTYAVTGNTIPGVVSTSINATGDLTLSYLPDQSGSGTVTVRATDTGGLWVETAFNVDVAAANDAPTSSGIADVSVSEDDAATTFNLYPSFADTEDADTDLTYAVTGNTIPGVVSTGIDAAGDLTLTYLPDQFGSGTTTVRATDSGGLWVETAFNVDVAAANDAPTTLGFADVAVAEDASTTTLNLDSAFDDLEDSDSQLTFAVTGNTLPSVVATTVGPSTLKLDYLPDQFGSGTVTVRATDSGGLWVETTFNVDVASVNDAPAGSLGSVSLAADSPPLTIDLLAAFADVDHLDSELTFAVLSNSDPALLGAAVDAAAGTLELTAAGGAGSVSLLVRASDPLNAAGDATLTVHVTAVAAPPPEAVAAPAEPAEGEGDGEESGSPLPVAAPAKPTGPPAAPPAARPAAPPDRDVQVVETLAAANAERIDVAQVDTLVGGFSLLDARQAPSASERQAVAGVAPGSAASQSYFYSATGFWNALDESQRAMLGPLDAQSVVIGTSAVAGGLLSVSYVVWLARGGYLLTTLMAQMPAWRLIDPLPVLDRMAEGSEGDASLEELLDDSNNQGADGDEPSAEDDDSTDR